MNHTDNEIISFNGAILRLQATQREFHDSFKEQFQQLKADLLEKMETKMEVYTVKIQHLDEKFAKEVDRGDKLFQRGLRELERHEEEDRARIDAVVKTQAKFEETLEKHDTWIKELQNAPAQELAQTVKDTKKTARDTFIQWLPTLLTSAAISIFLWLQSIAQTPKVGP